jgi:hypothetical protein
LPIEFPIVPDGLRPLDPDFQAEIDRRMLDILDTHDIKFETLTGTVDARMHELLDRIEA